MLWRWPSQTGREKSQRWGLRSPREPWLRIYKTRSRATALDLLPSYVSNVRRGWAARNCSRHGVGWRTVAFVYAAENTSSKSKFLTSHPPASPPSPDHNRFFGGDQAKLLSALEEG